MVARYGDRTRVSSQVSTWGKDVEGGAGLRQFNEQVFTAPGTWTWPGNTSLATVTIVGGGGGSGGGIVQFSPFGPRITASGAGGGGGVRIETVPVTGPVPVIVGAGGDGGALSPNGVLRRGGPGGDTSFGTFVVGGGGGGRENVGVPDPPAPGEPAPPNGGGGGSTAGAFGSFQGIGGLYGYPSNVGSGGGGAGSNGAWLTPTLGTGAGAFGFGAGGGAHAYNPREIELHPDGTPYFGDKPNSGNGAPRPFISSPPIGAAEVVGRNGSAGTVIVRWWE